MKRLVRKNVVLENIVNQAAELTHQIKDNQELFDLAKEEGDKETLKTIQT